VIFYTVRYFPKRNTEIIGQYLISTMKGFDAPYLIYFQIITDMWAPFHKRTWVLTNTKKSLWLQPRPPPSVKTNWTIQFNNNMQKCHAVQLTANVARNRRVVMYIHRRCCLPTPDSRHGEVDQIHRWQRAFWCPCGTWQHRRRMDEVAPCMLTASLLRRSTLCRKQHRPVRPRRGLGKVSGAEKLQFSDRHCWFPRKLLKMPILPLSFPKMLRFLPQILHL